VEAGKRPAVKSSRANIHRRYHKVPALRFAEDGRLTAYAGLVLVQVLIAALGLKKRLRRCFSHLGKDSIYGMGKMVLLLLVAILLGCRRLRDLDYCREDPLLKRVVGVKRLPDVATISRALTKMDERGVEGMRSEVRGLVLERLEGEAQSRVTVDFDGSVQTTRGHAEGTAVGYNPLKKGARSYYPLFCTVAQTEQFFDVLFRSGNVHDSNGASGFMSACLSELHERLPRAQLETRVDSAFFNERVLATLHERGVEFSCSVPFERFPALKALVKEQQQWCALDERYSYAEVSWKPRRWDMKYRILLVRQRKKPRSPRPIQLDLFVPFDEVYEYTVVATNKKVSPRAVLGFHHGRGSQEKLFGEAKQHAALDVILGRRQKANQLFSLCGMLAHNLSREMQMMRWPKERPTQRKRPAHWRFHSLGTLRQRLFHRAGRLLRPQGHLTLELNANSDVRSEFEGYLDAMLHGARFGAASDSSAAQA